MCPDKADTEQDREERSMSLEAPTGDSWLAQKAAQPGLTLSPTAPTVMAGDNLESQARGVFCFVCLLFACF